MLCKVVFLMVSLAVFVTMTHPKAARPDEPKPTDRLKGRIFVAVQTVRGVGGEKNPWRTYAILAVDPDTGASETIVPEATEPWVAADGKTMAYVSGEGVCVRLADGSSRVVRRQEPLTGAGAPVLSADGKEVICNVRRPPSKENPRSFETWRYPVAGGEPTKMPIPDSDGVSDWSADKQSLLTLRSGRGGGGLQLYVMRPDGTEQRRLSDGTGMVSIARFSADGKHIVYMHQLGDKNSLWVMDADGQHRTKIVDYRADRHPWACWSPDGKRLAVVDWNPRTSTEYRLDVMDADGRNRRSLPLPKAISMSAPDWR